MAILAGGLTGCSLPYRAGVYHDAEDEAICDALDVNIIYAIKQAQWNQYSGDKEGAKIWLVWARDYLSQFLAYCQWEPAEAYRERQQLFFVIENILRDFP